MDTGTHLVVGLGLAGLAHLDPVVASDPTIAIAVLVGTVLGSQAPDSDGLLRLKGNATYIRNHRGASHSIPALFFWTILVTAIVTAIFGQLPLGHLVAWIALAVCLHVFMDLFNTYGTQAYRPISDKWVSWNIIHIFDPFIFTAHLAAILMWSVHLGKPQFIFPILYGLLFIYYVWRSITHYVLAKKLKDQDEFHENGDRYVLIPTVALQVWNVVKRQSSGKYVLGELRGKELKWVDSVSCDDHPAVEHSKQHPDIASFLYFSSYACADVREHEWGYEVRWADVRYRHRKQYPFIAVLLMNRRYEPLDSYVGWVSDERLEKKLRVDTY